MRSLEQEGFEVMRDLERQVSSLMSEVAEKECLLREHQKYKIVFFKIRKIARKASLVDAEKVSDITNLTEEAA